MVSSRQPQGIAEEYLVAKNRVAFYTRHKKYSRFLQARLGLLNKYEQENPLRKRQLIDKRILEYMQRSFPLLFLSKNKSAKEGLNR